jgi:hypothetical protein
MWEFFLNSSMIFKDFRKKYNMSCHPMQDYFWKYFYMHDKFDIQHICTSMLAKFYSCKKWVLQSSTVIKAVCSSSSLDISI